MSPRAQWNKVKKHHHKKNKKIENGEHQAELQQLISGLNVNAEHHDIPSAPCAVLGTVVVESAWHRMPSCAVRLPSNHGYTHVFHVFPMYPMSSSPCCV